MTFNGTKLQPTRLRPLGLMAMLGAAGVLSGCLDRPVGQTKPETNNIFVEKKPSGGIDKIDILFMIDNSLSMGDKQVVLSAAVPQLLSRLTNPDCVDDAGVAVPGDRSPTDDCPAGTEREFAPVKDIHLGVVSSSLGDFGGNVCPENATESAEQGFPDQNDRGWLLGALPRANGIVATPFFSWTAQDAAGYGTSIGPKTTEFRNHVTAAGEVGCGLEMSLESWYRFLIDPKPPLDVTQTGQQMVQRNLGADGKGDPDILAQRAAFLRSDSLVAVVMLTDENDCSLKDSNSYSWLPAALGANFPGMWRGSAACANNPNDPCCYSCMNDLTQLQQVPANCPADPTCLAGNAGGKMQTADPAQPNYDNVSIRCLKQKQRFGFDFLFPVTRYSNALTMKEICPDQTYGDLDCACTEAKAMGLPCEPGASVLNPLYDNLSTVLPTGPDRDSSDAVFFAGITGVPWQDLATDDTLGTTDTLKYKLASELNWDLFAPDRKNALAAPGDPLMVEDTNPRPGRPGPDSPYGADPINGHEWNTGGTDLQFACVFSLDQPIAEGSTTATRNCVEAEYCAGAADAAKCKRAFQGCSCKGAADPATYTQNSPLCQSEAGAYSTTQTRAKAYPGTRQLQALRAFFESSVSQNNAIVASICPKNLDPDVKTGPNYGYNPAVAALVARLKEKLGGTCLPRPLVVDPTTGTVPCAVVEVIQEIDPVTKAPAVTAGSCACAQHGREEVDAGLEKALKGALERDKVCGGSTKNSCDNFCFCGLPELTGATQAGNECLNQPNVEKSASGVGFCYVDPAQGFGAEAVVAGCSSSQKRLIRIVGTQTEPAPAPGLVFVACSGAPFGS